MLILANEPLNIEKQISLASDKVQKMVSGAFGNNGFIIIADTELNDRFNYKSSDAGASAQRPKLVVQYTVNGPTPTPTLTPTPTTPPASVFSHAAFVYDGDGKRVKSAITTNVGTTTTYFVGNYYEVSGSTVTKYYYAGSQRIAMRQNGTPYYLLTDHLGSTSLITNAAGVVVSEMRYSAWGEVRYSSGSSPTKYQYTGQFSYAAEFGLLFYNARWYDGRLARFISADTILPGIENPQAWDRYSYGLNNPSRYTDPTGHMIDVGEGGSSLSTSLQQFLIYKKSIVLYKQTQKEVGGIDDLEAFAQLTEYAASLTLDCTACFVDNMGAVVTGYTGNHPGTMVILNRLNQDRFPLNRYYRALKDTHQELGQTGFAPIFRDNAGKANQSRHYWEYVQSGYFENWNYATAGNVFHETIDPSSDRNEKSYHDFVLGVEGADLGFLLHIGAVSPEGAGQYIRDNLSKDSFSAMFWSNPFGPWGPPPLWMPDQ